MCRARRLSRRYVAMDTLFVSAAAGVCAEIRGIFLADMYTITRDATVWDSQTFDRQLFPWPRVIIVRTFRL